MSTPVGKTGGPLRGLVRRVGDAFGIREGEYLVAASFFLYLLLVIAVTIVSKTVRDSLFLSKFGAGKLPLAYIAVALFVSPFISVYIRFTQRFKQHLVISCSLLILISNLVVFWWGLHVQKWGWTAPSLYLWDGIFGVVVPMQVWTLASTVFTTRQAKRVFGFIGGGGSLGAILGGFFSTWMVKLIGTDNLLLSIAVGLSLCIVLVNVIWFASNRNETTAPPGDRRDPPARANGLGDSFALLRKSKYLMFIAGLIAVTEIATTLVDYQFKVVATRSFESKDEMTSFFGQFYAYLGLGGFLLQVFLTGRIIRWVGIGVTILFLPTSLLIGTGIVFFFRSLWAAVLMKGPDQLFRHSIEKSTIELLYLPVPTDLKLAVKPFIDTIVYRVSDGIAGVLLFICTAVFDFKFRHISGLTIGVLGVWFGVALTTRRRYLDALRTAVVQKNYDAVRLGIAAQGQMPVTGLFESFVPTAPLDILYFFGLFESVDDKRQLTPHLEPFLEHPSPEVRAKAVDLLATAGDRGTAGRIKPLLRDPALEVQIAAVRFFIEHSGVPPTELTTELLLRDDFDIRGAIGCFLLVERKGRQYFLISPEVFDALLHSPDPAARTEAAHALGVIPPPSRFHESLPRLLEDAHPAVAAEAVASVGRIGRREFIPLVVARLADRRTRPAATATLVGFGSRILGTLRDYLVDPAVNVRVRKAIPRIVSRIGSQEAVDILSHALGDANAGVRYSVIRGLNRLRRSAPDYRFDERIIRRHLDDELKRSYRELALLYGYNPRCDWSQCTRSGQFIENCLRERLQMTVERVSRLLGLLYNQTDIHTAYLGVLSKNAATRSNAMELLDTVLVGPDRQGLLPLIDDDVLPADKMRIAGGLGVLPLESSTATLAELFETDDPVLLLAALDAVAAARLEEFGPRIATVADHSERFVREAAEKLLAEFQVQRLMATSRSDWPAIAVDGKKHSGALVLTDTVAKNTGDNGHIMAELTTLEKIKYLQHIDIFANCRFEQLIHIASFARETRFAPGETIFQVNDPGDSVYCIIAGTVRSEFRTSQLTHEERFGANDAIGMLDVVDRRPRTLTCVALDDVTALRIDSEDFYELLADNVEIMQGVLSHLTSVIRDRLMPVLTHQP